MCVTDDDDESKVSVNGPNQRWEEEMDLTD